MSTILNRILIIVFAIIFLISGGLILRYFLASRQVEQQYDRLAQQFHQAEKKEKSRTSEDEILPQYKELLAQNSDLVGWIRQKIMKNICIMHSTDPKVRTAVSLPTLPAT